MSEMPQTGFPRAIRCCSDSQVFHGHKAGQCLLWNKNAKSLFPASHRLQASHNQLEMMNYVVVQNDHVRREVEVPVIFAAVDGMVANFGRSGAKVNLQPRGLRAL